MAEEALTFNALLTQFVEAQMKAVEQGGGEMKFLERAERQTLLNKVKDVVEDVDKPKLFDRTSLKNINSLFDEAERFRTRVTSENHPSNWIYPNPEEWYQQSYKFMYDSVSFLELVRFFAGGKTQDEKEIFFRTLVSKLIKTQETVRTIGQNKEFLSRYFSQFPDLEKNYPVFLSERLKQPEPFPPAKALLISLKMLVDSLSRSSLKLLEELDIGLPDAAQKALDSKLFYDALILTMRHAPTDLFGDLGSDDYSILVEELAKISQQSHFHPNVFLFQHIKRNYLIDWLVNTLRQLDRDGSETFYQAGKAEVYENFAALDVEKGLLDQLKEREQLDNPEVLEEEIKRLNTLSEDEIYALLLKMYTAYKNDELLAGEMPLAPQALSSSGDISWDKQNLVAQANKKAKDLEASGGGAKAGRFKSMFVSLKKASKVFTMASKKVDDKKKSVGMASTKVASAEAAPPSEPPGPPPPVIKMEHTGVRIEPCFPMPKRDCLSPVPGQKQDLSFNNSDSDAGVAPLEQEFIVNMFNVGNEPNLPKLNPNYTKWQNTVATILRSYGDEARRVQKKYVSGVNVDSFNEEVLYLRTREDVVIVFGTTQMGQGKSVGTMPNKQTSYFRLFVKGDMSKGLTKFGVPSALKEFLIEEKSHQFKEISIPTHYKEAPKYQALLVDSLAAVIEGLPQTEYDMLKDENMIGFVPVLQEKARDLIEKKGVDMERAGEAS